MRPLILLSLLLAFAPQGARAQDRPDRDLRRADQLYAAGHWDRAIPLYGRALQRGYDAEACARLADAHFRLGDYADAEHWYAQAVLSDQLDPERYRDYARALRANGKEERAREWFERFDRYTVEPGAYREDYALAAGERAEPAAWRVRPLGLNTRWREIAPALYGDRLVFAADRPAPREERRAPQTGAGYFDLFIADADPASREAPARLEGRINGPWHEAGFAIDPVDGSAWFARTASRGGVRQRRGDGNVPMALYRARPRARGGWRRPERLSAVPRAWTAMHPAFSPSGDRLYFSARPPESARGFDLWYCKRQAGGWSDPVRLGTAVNTEGNEGWPFCAGPDRLYFASDGHPGLGGLDLYVADRVGSGWDEPRHLPAPMSSPRDDFGLVVRDNQGFFGSDRRGGAGGDDLYAFERLRVPVLVAVVNAASGQPVSGAVVECIADGRDNESQRTDARGEARFDLPPGRVFYLAVRKDGFEPAQVGDTRNRERFTLALRPVSAEGQAPATPPGPAAAPDSTARPDPEAAPDPAVAPAAAPADPDPSARPAARAGYRVRVGIFRHPDRERLARLERFGPLGTEPRDGGLTAFFLGPFPDAAAAADVLARVRAAGHTDAFVEYVQP